MKDVVGISQKIKRMWMDQVLDAVIGGVDESRLRGLLDAEMRDGLPGATARAKRVSIVLRIWSNVSPPFRPLRDRALALVSDITRKERLWLHWGMTALTYPFFRDTAEIVGRLISLQGDVTATQVQVRIATTWGDRETSLRAAKYLLNTMTDWEVLRTTNTRGRFVAAGSESTVNTELQMWLLEALLTASSADEIEVGHLLRLPGAFPFALDVGVAQLRRHKRFDVHRQGLDTDLIAVTSAERNL
jgi:hypothetical protein